jgi:hypothetical protein
LSSWSGKRAAQVVTAAKPAAKKRAVYLDYEIPIFLETFKVNTLFIIFELKN